MTRPDFNVSRICFGTWSFGGEWGSVQVDKGKVAMRTALDLGINFCDTTQTPVGGPAPECMPNATSKAVL